MIKFKNCQASTGIMDKKQVAAFERKVKKTIDKYELIEQGDKVLVACSGGKDSTTTLYLLQKWGYKPEALYIDLHIGDYSKKNLENVKGFCGKQGIKLNLVDLRLEFGSSICYIREGIQGKKNLSNCTICGVVKRWILNKKAKELHADKLATGHNLNDESETVFMNLLKGNPELGMGMGQKTGRRKDSGFVQRIKPLYFCTNEETRAYSEAMGFPVIYEPCPCSIGVFRRKVRRELALLEQAYPDVRLKLVRNFLRLLPELRSKAGPVGSINECEVCGEPSRNKICRLCSLIGILNKR
jgi:tRNA-5-methyluridine54 2-sulfurtransferase